MLNAPRINAELNDFLAGWFQYYGLAAFRGDLQRINAWIRRKLCCFRLKQRKRGKAIATFLQRQGVPADQAWRMASSGKGWWRLALSPPVKRAMSKEWFSQQELAPLLSRYAAVHG